MKQKTISLYVKGGTADAGYYYRFHQYFRELPVHVYHHKMYDDWTYSHFLPTRGKPNVILAWLWIYNLVRVFFQLLHDCVCNPSVLVISRRLVSRKMPHFYGLFLKYIKWKGTIIIWDFDDNILANKECDLAAFSLFSMICEHVIVASPLLKSLVEMRFQPKITYLPSTDGELFHLNNISNQRKRELSFRRELNLIWLGTSVSLQYVSDIFPFLELAAKKIGNIGKRLVLTVVCDKTLDVDSKVVKIVNVKWSRKSAIKALETSHVGLMPLEINKFNEGKGGFKLIQYLSIGLPVVATGVGINKIIVDASVGRLASGLNDEVWCNALVDIAKDIEYWKQLSVNASNQYEKNYSYEYNLNKWKELIYG